MVRDKICILYYPGPIPSPITIKKAILLFDEIHLMDHPSFSYGDFGMVGWASPLRSYEKALQEEGLQFYVHKAPGGPVQGKLLEEVVADINDPQFLSAYQDSLKTSETFRNLQIAPGNYIPHGTEKEFGGKLMGVDLRAGLANHKSAMELFRDKSVRHFELRNPTECAKVLISHAVTCSTVMNFALGVGVEEGFIPLADASPFGNLLGVKYARAIEALGPKKNNILATDLSFAVFDELVSGERIAQLSFKQVIDYRKASAGPREELLQHLADIQAKQAGIGSDDNYNQAIRRIVETEIVPAARKFKQKLKEIDDSLYAALVKSGLDLTLTAAGTTAINIYGDLSWQRLLTLAATGAGYAASIAGKAAIDAYVSERKAKRECSISYILSLDK